MEPIANWPQEAAVDFSIQKNIGNLFTAASSDFWREHSHTDNVIDPSTTLSSVS